MHEQLQAYKLSTESLVRQMEGAAAAGGRHGGEDMHAILQRHKEAQAELLQQQSPAVAALLQSAQAQAAAAAAAQAQQGQQREAKPPAPKMMV